MQACTVSCRRLRSHRCSHSRCSRDSCSRSNSAINELLSRLSRLSMRASRSGSMRSSSPASRSLSLTRSPEPAITARIICTATRRCTTTTSRRSNQARFNRPCSFSCSSRPCNGLTRTCSSSARSSRCEPGVTSHQSLTRRCSSCDRRKTASSLKARNLHSSSSSILRICS